MRDAIPVYDAFQDAVADAGASVPAQRILDLGTGTGETARRVLGRHPGARVVGIACGPHPRYGSACVIDQAGSFK